MDRREASDIAESILEELRDISYHDLVVDYLDAQVHSEVVADSGTRYTVEVDASWDSKDPGDLRVMVAIDDGGWSAISPVHTSFIIAPDGSFVGE